MYHNGVREEWEEWVDGRSTYFPGLDGGDRCLPDVVRRATLPRRAVLLGNTVPANRVRGTRNGGLLLRTVIAEQK